MFTDFLLSAWPFVIGMSIGILVLIYLIVAALEWVAAKNTEAFIKRMHKENEESHARIMEQVHQYRAARKSYQSSSFSPSSSDRSSSVNDVLNYSSFYDGSLSSDTSSSDSSCSSSSDSSSDSSSSGCGSSGGD